MLPFHRHLELSLVIILLLAGAAFLLKMCYLSLAFNTAFAVVFLSAIYAYLRTRYQLRIPLLLLVLVFLAVQVDALGNYFHLYGQKFGSFQYDEFSHMAAPALVTPIIVWLLHGLLHKLGQHLPLTITSFFAATTMFSLAAFYEIIELWDEVYFGGQRIWSAHDTATDLQMDLCGIVIGCLLTSVTLGLTALKSRTKAQMQPA